MDSVGDRVRKRRRLFEERLDWVVSWNEARQPELHCTCPCCGYPTLLERDSYEICELCYWEDTEQDEYYPDEARGGPNGKYSLTRARENFARHMSMYDAEELEDGDFAKDSPVEDRAKRTMMEAFEAMIGEDSSARSVRWQRVYAAEGELASEFNKKVQEYETRIRGQSRHLTHQLASKRSQTVGGETARLKGRQCKERMVEENSGYRTRRSLRGSRRR